MRSRSRLSSFVLLCFILIGLTSLGSCSWKGTDSVSLTGEINEESVGYIFERLSPATTLVVNSGGGHNKDALDLAEYIFEHNVHVVFRNECLSACALFILPAAKNRTIEPDLLVGYHGSPAMLNFLYRKQDPEGREDCHSELADRMMKLHQKTETGGDLWYADMLVLGPTNIRFLADDSYCGKIQYDEVSRMWFPTATQLKVGANLDIGQDSCNSNTQCVIDRVEGWNRKRYTYTIGKKRVALGR